MTTAPRARTATPASTSPSTTETTQDTKQAIEIKRLPVGKSALELVANEIEKVLANLANIKDLKITQNSSTSSLVEVQNLLTQLVSKIKTAK